MRGLILFVIWSIIVCVQGDQVCYNHIGCFQNTPPYTNSLGKLPKSPDHIRPSFTLHTRQNVNSTSQQLDPYRSSTITASSYDVHHKTAFIVHGFHGTKNDEWVQPLVKALLDEDAMNVIVVDWSGGSFDTYDQAVANTRVVGAVIAELVKALHNTTQLDYSNIHLIGHSLGSHICGFAGERIPGLGRITGLDPAGPLFYKFDPAVRIDSQDAVFVDIIHTDGTRYGLNVSIGDVDFYPNGGVHQPMCISDHLDPSIACSHVRAIYYFTESINSACHFRSYPCKSKADFDAHNCTSCGSGCPSMGYHVDHNASGSYYLKTNWHYPFCSNKN